MTPSDLPEATWRKSSYSGSGNDCVEVATPIPGVVAIRDSKEPGGPVLMFNRAAWRAFLADMR